MKLFLIQCLKDLESLTGIRQLYYLQSDLEDGERKKEVLLKGMILTCQEFDYIPEARQKAIIASQMRQDLEYDALNSRTIWKWLNAFKSPYLNPPQLQDKEVVLPPMSPETEKMVREWQMSLLDKPSILNVEAEMAKIKAEDALRQSGEELKPVSESIRYKPDPERIRLQELKAQYGRECCDLYTGRPKDENLTFELWMSQLK